MMGLVRLGAVCCLFVRVSLCVLCCDSGAERGWAARERERDDKWRLYACERGKRRGLCER